MARGPFLIEIQAALAHAAAAGECCARFVDNRRRTKRNRASAVVANHEDHGVVHHQRIEHQYVARTERLSDLVEGSGLGIADVRGRLARALHAGDHFEQIGLTRVAG